MTIREAIVAALEDWAQDPGFDANDQVEWLEQHVNDVVTDWMVDHGYTFNHTDFLWEKKP